MPSCPVAGATLAKAEVTVRFRGCQVEVMLRSWLLGSVLAFLAAAGMMTLQIPVFGLYKLITDILVPMYLQRSQPDNVSAAA